MKLRAVDWLVCPTCSAGLRLADPAGVNIRSCEHRAPPQCSVCRTEQSAPHEAANVHEFACGRCHSVEIMSGRLICANEHEYEIFRGVPRMIDAPAGAGARLSRRTSLGDPDAIRSSFDREWSHFDYSDRTWALDVEARRELFLAEMNIRAQDLGGAIVLDAGCGNGALSSAISDLGCEVVASDVSGSVERAFEHFARKGNDRTYFVRSDLTQHPFKQEVFDFIYSSGVLHHNPDTRTALKSVLRTLKRGGKIYIWVYHRIPGIRHAAKQCFRSAIAPLPASLKHAAIRMWLPQAMLRQYVRTAFGLNTAADRLRWRERLVLLLDHYTPRYRWEHTQAEVHGWYREMGLENIATTEVREWGFGVVGRRPEGTPTRLVYSLNSRSI